MEPSERLVSIIVPVYNRVHWISCCIESVLCQTHRAFQLILVDDGSKDQSLAVCRDYAERDKRITVLHQSNQGPGPARNAGLDAAAGDYITFVDSDDSIHPRYLELLLTALIQTDAGLAQCELGESDRHGAAPAKIQGKPECKSVSPVQHLAEMLYGRAPAYCWGKLWKKSRIAGLRFRNLSFCEDVVFTAEALAGCTRDVVEVSCGPLYSYYRHRSSITRTLSPDNLLDSLRSGTSVLSLAETQPETV